MSLMHEHWQENASNLSQELQYILQHYNETYRLDWNMKDFVLPDFWQVVKVKNSIEGIFIFEKWLEKQTSPDDKTRVFYTKDKSYLVLLQRPSGDVDLIQASPLMLIQKGELQPLCLAVQLHYNQDLELKPNVTQYLQMDPHNYLRFRAEKKQIHGMAIRGYIFQNKLEPKGKLNEFPEIYYPLKKVEQYFIDRKSDPDYQELVQVLEKSLELYKLNHPEAQSFGTAALERGRSALENIFVNDNIIQALVDQLVQEVS